MTIQPFSTRSTQVIIRTDEALSEHMSNDIWKIILSYLGADSKSCHIVSMASVSKKFLDVCLSSFKSLSFSLRSLERSNQVMEARDWDQLPTTIYPIRIECFDKSIMPVPYDSMQRLLTVDRQGRQYTCSIWRGYSHILFIMDPITLQVVALDLVEEMKKAEIDKSKINNMELPHGCQNGQRIVSCHATNEGFILVTCSGCSIWKWEEDGQLTCHGFASPFKHYRGCHTEIRYSGFQEGILLTQSVIAGRGNLSLHVCVVEDENPTFTKARLSPNIELSEAFFSIQNIEERIHLSYELNAQMHYLPIQMTKSKSWTVESNGEALNCVGRLLPISMPNWTLEFTRDSCLYVTKNGHIWMGEEHGLQKPDESKNERYFIHQDFLLLSYQNGAFRLVHLPTKRDYPLRNQEALQLYLAQRGAILHGFSVEHDKQGYRSLRLLFQPPGDHLYTVSIPLELPLQSQVRHSYTNFLSSLKAINSTECEITAEGLSRILPKRYLIDGEQHVLSVDQQGRQYSCSRAQYSAYRHILLIMDPASLEIITLDLVKEMEKAGIDGNFQAKGKRIPHGSQQGQRIVSCHPTQEGFVLVTSSGCSVWKWEEDGKPSFQRFASPFHPYKNMFCAIYSSCLQEDKLLISGRDARAQPFLNICDLKADQLTFSKISCSTSVNDFSKQKQPPIHDTYVRELEGQPHLLYCSKEHGIDFLPIQITKKDVMFYNLKEGLRKGVQLGIERFGEEALHLEGTLEYPSLPTSISNWTVHFQAPHLYILKNGSVWMGKDEALQMPDSSKNERYFIHQDFLLLSYQTGKFRLIHLTTKTDYSLKYHEVLEQYLAQKKAILHSFSFSYDEQNSASLDLLFQTAEKEGRLTLHTLTIPLGPCSLQEDEPQTIVDIYDNHQVTTQTIMAPDQNDLPEPLPLNPQNKMKEGAPSCLANKVVLITGIVLFTLMMSASIALIVLHPGIIIYEGSGIILTLPALLTLSIGGPTALITIAIGSYFWWKESQKK